MSFERLLTSGADHERVARENPHWTEKDWCWYWERDLLKALKKAGIVYSQESLKSVFAENCGEGCVCAKKR